MRTLGVFLFAIAGAAFDAAAQAPLPRVASLDWMSGTWTHHEGRERVTESWLGPANGLMVATNLSAWPDGKKTYEFLRIAETPEGFSYFSSPGGRPPVEFKLKELGERRVVFEDAGREFPRRILYWREGEHLRARIEGTVGGKERFEEWRFTRAVER